VKRLFWVLALAALIGIGLFGWWLLKASTSPEVGADLQHRFQRREQPTEAGDSLPRQRVTAILVETTDPGSDAGAISLLAPDEEKGDVLDADAGLGLLEFKRMLAQNAEAATRNVERFCELSRKLSKVKAFSPGAPRSRDASLYLSSRVDWEGGTIGSLHLPKPLTERMAALAWMSFKPADYAGLDFAWLTELLEYDTWSMSKTGPLRDLNITNFYEAPIPNFVSLQQWSKLRLAKGLNENDLPRASLEVQHLADLCGSTDILIGGMIRSAILGIERSMYERLGQPLPEALPTADEAFAYRRTTFASMYFLYPGVPRSVREKAIACSAARCSAITEALGISAGARQLVPEAQENLEWLLSQHPCDGALADSIARSPPVGGDALAKQVLIEGGVNLDDLLSFDAGFR